MLKFTWGACFVAVLARGVQGDLVRRLSYEQIAGYEPGSDVIQHNMLDLDQAEMETHLKTPYYDKAKAIYTLGGNSGAKAEITVAALAADAAKGAVVKQGTVAVGKMKSAASAGATKITVSYTTSVCKEGGLATKDVSGCFTVAGGPLTVGDVDIGAPTGVTNAYRTLAGFSTAAEKKMTGQEYFDIYKAYFGPGDYAHQRVMAALDKTGICSACDEKARVQIAKKTSAYMNVWMYVIREFEDAIEDCKAGCIDCNDDPVHAWDEGVAFYTGSLEGVDGSGSGKMLHALADKRCKNYNTCSAKNGGSAVNEALFELFELGKSRLQQGKCDDVKPLKKTIVELMSVPLVQGALRYAFKMSFLQGGSKEYAEGAAFSAAILPRVAHCNADSAKIIADNMNIDSATPMAAGFEAVKAAFENTYTCLGITCAQVGGLIESGTTYYEGFSPCKTSYELIAGYEPGSDVTQHNMLDLDQAEMETHLKVPDFAKAKAIYLYGGNSGAKAEITVSALAADAAKGAVVKQGTVGLGTMKSAASAGATKITVSYSSVCKEGGLATQDTSGCFTVGGGAITVGGVDIGAPTAVANKYRTLSGFSTAAEKKMTGQEYFDIYKA